jgi:drug/metabolite transporter (DMT)-like permease
MNKQTSKAVFFVAALLWGASYPFQKPLLETISPTTFTFWNFSISGIIFLLYAIYNRIPLVYRWREGVMLGLMLSGLEIFEMVGLHTTLSANAVFLTNFGMLLVPFAGWILFRHRIERVDFLSMALATFGMYLLVGGIHGFSTGDFFLLLSALSCAFYFVYSERFEAERASHVTTLCIQQFVVISLVCFLWNMWSGESFAVASHTRGLLLLEIVAFTTLPYAIIQWASRYADEIIAAVYDGIVEPIVGCLVAWFIFLEPATRYQFIGGIIMLFAFAFSALLSDKHFIKHVIKGFFKLEKEIELPKM